MAKTYLDGAWSQSKFLTWIRAQLRARWLKSEFRGNALKKFRVRVKGVRGEKWGYVCNLCNKELESSQIKVDHFPIDAGSIKDFNDIGPFVDRLFCDSSGLRVLCKECHDLYTLSSDMGITMEQAVVEKQVIQFKKLSAQKQKETLLNYYEQGMIGKVESKRVEQYREVLNARPTEQE